MRCIQVGSDITFILQLSLASREPCAATAVGVAKVHQEEAKTFGHISKLPLIYIVD